MKVIVCAAMLLVTSCHRDWKWHGVVGPLTCAYSTDNEKHCVGGGHAYLCIPDWDNDTMECAPMPSAVEMP